jgi:hypothetical protein
MVIVYEQQLLKHCSHSLNFSFIHRSVGHQISTQQASLAFDIFLASIGAAEFFTRMRLGWAWNDMIYRLRERERPMLLSVFGPQKIFSRFVHYRNLSHLLTGTF